MTEPKKLTKKEYDYVKRVADDSFNSIINVDELREAFKILTNNDLANMRVIRNTLWNFRNNATPLVEETTTTSSTTTSTTKKQLGNFDKTYNKKSKTDNE